MLPDRLQKLDKSDDEWLYIGDEKMRYVLGKPGNINMLVFGVNPSRARPGVLDPTMKRVVKTVENGCCDGWIMVNLYPLRSKKPADLPDKPNKAAAENNITAISAIKDCFQLYSIWAAWGTAIEEKYYLYDELNKIVDIYENVDISWYVKGKTTANGHPRHPLYVAADAPMEYFPVNDYRWSWR